MSALLLIHRLNGTPGNIFLYDTVDQQFVWLPIAIEINGPSMRSSSIIKAMLLDMTD
jgi:hypothetical protein